jgi:hypothetical protein
MFNLRRIGFLLLIATLSVSIVLAQPTTGTVKGILTDDSGAVIPAASVTLAGNGVTKTAQTQGDGTYTFAGLAPGQYTVSTVFPGFTPFSKVVTVAAGSSIQVSVKLSVTAEKQEVTVKEDAGPSVNVEPDSNATALTLKGEDLAALPDDPDDLADALQALAGPGAGPNGGSIYIDGFTGGNLPPKESIREIRVNQNPFSAEYDHLGFGRIEILTKPGTDKLRGTVFFNDSNDVFNSRNPYASNKPSFSNRMYGGNIGGPLGHKASFFLDFNKRDVQDNAILKAVYLVPTAPFNSVMNINTALVTPNGRWDISPRLDYQLNGSNTLVVRFNEGTSFRDNQGVGGYKLPAPYSQSAYNATGNNQNLMITETAVLNTHVVNETRFQFARNLTDQLGNEIPITNVSQSFVIGGNGIGTMSDVSRHYELQNYTSISHGTHTIRFGGRFRRDSDSNYSPNGYGGTFSFLGGVGAVLDANNQPVLGPDGSVLTQQITSLEQYRRTLLFQSMGYDPTQIRALGGEPSKFTMSAGNPYVGVARYDAGPFVQDDWRVKPNFTLSLGMRYEVQTLAGGFGDVAPRVGFAWAPGSSKNGRQKTVIRGGFGLFYDRISLGVIENVNRYNGTNQLSYVVNFPNFYPNIPLLSSLTPQQNSTYSLNPNFVADYSMQGAIGVEHQLPRNTTVAVTYTFNRANHLQQTVPINAPLPGTFIQGVPNSGVFPYGSDAGNLYQYQSGGLMRQDIIMVNFNTRLTRNTSLFGNYSYNHANDISGMPSNPYNFAQDWGRSSFSRTNRFQLIGSILVPFGLRLNPFVTLQSGAPFDVQLGQDLYGDNLLNARPAFATNVPAGVTPLSPLYYNANPSPNGPFIPRNYLTGAGLIAVNLRVGRTFFFGPPRGGTSASSGGFGGDHGHGPGGGGGGPRGGGGMRMGGPGGGMGGMFGEGSSPEHRYSITLSVMGTNIMNHLNPGGYQGVLSSPQFGQATTVNTGFGGGPGGGGGSVANNRRLELSARFNF